ncbi:MAG TPA: phage holin family protein [Micromonosporaceae bacterium]|nr:phage holin family protein [Micromonosporaceae bacterium]
MIQYEDVPVPNRSPDEMGTAELVRAAYAQVSTLVRDEIALAKLELAEKGKKAGIGAGLFGAAGAFAFYGLGTLIATAVLALSLAWPAWLAALTVAIVLFVLAGIAALIGKKRVEAASPPFPTEATHGISADLETMRNAVQARGNREQ